MTVQFNRGVNLHVPVTDGVIRCWTEGTRIASLCRSDQKKAITIADAINSNAAIIRQRMGKVFEKVIDQGSSSVTTTSRLRAIYIMSTRSPYNCQLVDGHFSESHNGPGRRKIYESVSGGSVHVSEISRLHLDKSTKKVSEVSKAYGIASEITESCTFLPLMFTIDPHLMKVLEPHFPDESYIPYVEKPVSQRYQSGWS